MSQSGFTPILIYASGTTGNTPSASNLTSSANGAELALNYYDGKLFYKDSGGVVQVIATKAGASGTVSSVSGTGTVSGITLTGTVTTSGSLTLGGTLNLSSPPAIGGTTPNTGAFTTLSASTSITSPILNAGTSTALQLQSNGTTGIYMDTSQNVGIGTSSPSTYGKLVVQSGTTALSCASSDSVATR